jgi:hypothetical protein
MLKTLITITSISALPSNMNSVISALAHMIIAVPAPAQ